MSFISSKENKAIVNLDKVTYIHPAEGIRGGESIIYFVFDSMIEGEVNEIKWTFKDLDRFRRVLNSIEIRKV